MEEIDSFDDDVEEEVSECVDHIFENSKSNNNFEEEDEIDLVHHLVPEQT